MASLSSTLSMPIKVVLGVIGVVAVVLLVAWLYSGGREVLPLCKGGIARPITTREALKALRSHGYRVRSEERSSFCDSDVPIVAELRANIHDGEVELFCHVRKNPAYPHGMAIVLPRTGKGGIHVVNANLDCGAYPGRDTNIDVQEKHLATALSSLAP